MPVDLDAVDRALAAPHVIELHGDGWTIMHPLSCRPNLFDCPINRTAEDQITEPLGGVGRFEVTLDGDGTLLIGRPVTGDLRDPIDVAAMAAELRATRTAIQGMRAFVGQAHPGGHVGDDYWQDLTRARRSLREFDERAGEGER